MFSTAVSCTIFYTGTDPKCFMQKRLSVTVDTDLHKALRVKAAYNDESMNTVVVKALEMYLRECPKCGSNLTELNDG